MAEIKKYNFEKLTPIDNSDIHIYESAIDFVFKNNDITNVAISGAYGAGKSSVLASYKGKHKEKTFLHISLAHFQNNSVDSDDGISNAESVLEGKILNQLIHQMPASKIPQTNFRIKKTTNDFAVWCQSIILIIFVLSLIHIKFFSNWGTFINTLPVGKIRSFLCLTTSSTSLLFSGLVCIISVGFLIFKIVQTQKNKNIFRKLSIQGTEIEIFADSNDSYFDKYLNEVLYLFENVDAEVIVFEDMDRFEVSRIFERLREINTLVNLQRKKDNKPVLRFFYLLRDDIFVSKDRTKFFDYIIPIVPVVDGSNSYDQLISHLEKNDLISEFNEGFLQGISLYIDDMRLLKNICNEFLIYYNRLNTTELDYNKMFALITYKNLFPKDFSELQLNKGFVYTIFDHKDSFTKDSCLALEAKIQELSERIENANDEFLISQEELDRIFNPKRNYYSKKLNDKDQADYDKRLQAITDNNNSTVYALEKEIFERQEQLQQIKNSPLAYIITRENIDSIFAIKAINDIGIENEFNDIKGSEYFDLVKYLIRNGYIDETYADYMTYFYENSLSRIDKTFLRSITDKKAKPYNYALQSAEKVFDRLQLIDFDNEETLNFSLFDYLLSKKSQSEQIKRFISQIYSTGKYNFIAQYFNYTSFIPAFIQIINKQWPSFFVDIQSVDGFTVEQVKRFSVESIYHLDNEALSVVNKDNALTEYINKSEDYLNIENPNIEKLLAAFKQLNIRFPKLDYELSEKCLLLSVYENNLYELNFENITMFLINIWNIQNVEDIKHKSYTIINRNPQSSLYKYIDSNISVYINIILSECDNLILDDECVAINLLNRTDVNTLDKETYIGFLKTPLHNLSSFVDRDIWSKLLSSGILICSEQNIFEYFHHRNKIDTILVNFINNTDKPLNFSLSKIDLTTEDIESLFKEIITCNDICDYQYSNILTSLDYTLETFSFPNIQKSKITILIKNNIIHMTPDNLKYIRNEYPSSTLYFIRENIEEYENIMDSGIFVQSELLEILSWDIADDTKISILNYSDDKISIIGKNYSTKVCVHILKNNLLQSDMNSLYLSYDEQPTEIQEIIFNNAQLYIDDIIQTPLSATKLLNGRLLTSTDILIETRIELLISMFPHIDIIDARKYLSILNLDEYVKIFDSYSKPKFEITSQNECLLDAFKENGWIFEYLKDDIHPGYYKIRRREPKNR